MSIKEKYQKLMSKWNSQLSETESESGASELFHLLLKTEAQMLKLANMPTSCPLQPIFSISNTGHATKPLCRGNR